MNIELPESVESVDAIAEPFRAFYTEGDDGTYALNSQFSEAAKTITGLNGALRKARAEAKSKASQGLDLGPLTEYGESPAEIAERIAELKAQLEGVGSKSKDAAQRLRAELAEQHRKEVEQISKQANGYQSQLVEMMVNHELTTAMQKLNARQGAAKLLAPVIREKIKPVVNEIGRLELRVLDKGEEAYGLDGAPMSIQELAGQFRKNDEFAWLFESEAKGGGGMPPSGGRGIPTNTAELSAAQKIAAGLTRR